LFAGSQPQLAQNHGNWTARGNWLGKTLLILRRVVKPSAPGGRLRPFRQLIVIVIAMGARHFGRHFPTRKLIFDKERGAMETGRGHHNCRIVSCEVPIMDERSHAGGFKLTGLATQRSDDQSFILSMRTVSAFFYVSTMNPAYVSLFRGFWLTAFPVMGHNFGMTVTKGDLNISEVAFSRRRCEVEVRARSAASFRRSPADSATPWPGRPWRRPCVGWQTRHNHENNNRPRCCARLG
jgi:hypothetical protein